MEVKKAEGTVKGTEYEYLDTYEMQPHVSGICRDMGHPECLASTAYDLDLGMRQFTHDNDTGTISTLYLPGRIPDNWRNLTAAWVKSLHPNDHAHQWQATLTLPLEVILSKEGKLIEPVAGFEIKSRQILGGYKQTLYVNREEHISDVVCSACGVRLDLFLKSGS